MDDLHQRVETEFWVAYANRVQECVKVLSDEACYGCSHKKTSEADHNVCLLGEDERIRRFLAKADGRISRQQIVEDWKNLIHEFSPPMEQSQMLLFDESWIDAQFRRHDKHANLLRIMCSDDEVQLFEFPEAGGGDFQQPWNQVESGLAQWSNQQFKELTNSIEDVAQPVPFDEEMYSEALPPSVTDILMQEQEDAEIIAELLEEGTTKENEFSQLWSEANLRNAYEITKTSQRRVAKFNTTATDYLVHLKDLNLRSLKEVLGFLEALFSNILSTVTAGMQTNDKVRFVMHSSQLSYPISLPFMPLTDLTPTRIMFEIERVLQSNEEFSLDGNVHLNLIHVAMPSGGKGKIGRGGVNFKKRLQTKRCFVQIKNKDELCLARAIVTAIAHVNENPNRGSFTKGAAIQRNEAVELHQRAGVPLIKCGLEEVKKFQEKLPECQIVIVSAEQFDQIVYKGPDSEKVIYLYYHDGHFDVIKSMPAFLNRAKFCLKCCKGYDVEDKRHHGCDKCPCCHKKGCPDVDQWRRCDDCTRYFKGPTCFANHSLKSGAAKSVCETYMKCTKCHRVIDRTQRNPADHNCGEIRCSNCKTFVDPESHRCYMQPLKRTPTEAGGEEVPKKRKKVETNVKNKPKYLFFDFECMQDTGIHVPNLVVAQDENGQESVFSGPDARDKFCDWLFSEDLRGTVCIAHNLKGYDAYFILQYLYENKVKPDLIMNGAKVMTIEVSEAQIKFIDSLNFLTMPLSHLPNAFGFKDLSKGYFPHLFNTRENQTYVGEIPDTKYFDPEGMKTEEQAKFRRWHEDQKQKKVVFNLQEELLKYCRSDVTILRQCCLEFRSLVMGLCDVDPFEQCITIASVCNTIFRKSFLKTDTIAIIPPQGYRPKVKQSILAHKWLAYESHKRGIRIQHGRNGGEKKVESYYLDGYDEESKTAFEFDGCFYHGHNLCYPGYLKNKISGRTMQELFDKTLEKRKYLEASGLNLVHIWECEFNQQLKSNGEMAAYVKQLPFAEEEPLNPRDAFFGGRVNATKLLVNAKEDEKIKYLDFTSLYPWVNKYGIYPIGHPKIITHDFDDIRKYFGLVKCVMLPPRGLYHPVLPFKGNGKLMFALCRTCALATQQLPCHHTDKERALHGTWVTLEIELALKMGYQVVDMFEVWHFEEKTDQLFKGYVDTFLKRKQQASGWPRWCQTENDKKLYIKQYKENEGIDLEYDAIKTNEAERSVWKQILNNFWGKFGQRPNHPKVNVISDPKEFFDLITSSTVEVTNANIVNQEVIEVHYRFEEGFLEPSDRTNVVLAAFTTAQARIKLYDLLNNLGRQVVYYDTDSVIFTVKKDQWEPPLGDFLGELKNELDAEDHITTFVSAGPKNYGYRTASGKTTCKVRGLTLNNRTHEKVNIESMTELVSQRSQRHIDVVTPHTIIRDGKTKNVYSKTEVKKYRLVYDKRVIQSDFDTVPYGY